jgi:hypothetical protein
VWVGVGGWCGEARRAGLLSSDGRPALAIRLAVATAVADTFMWQMAASVVIPGLIINRAVCSTERVVDYMSTSSLARVPHAREPHANSAALSRVLNKPAFRRFAPTAVGLSLIPLISACRYLAPSLTRPAWLSQRRLLARAVPSPGCFPISLRFPYVRTHRL